MFRRLWRGIRWVNSMMELSSELNLGLAAAGVAFFSLLALFPALGTIVALWGLFADPTVLGDQIGAYDEVVPNVATTVIDSRLHALSMQPKQSLGVASAASFLIALWVSRVAIGGLMRAMNTVYRTSARGRVHHNSLSLGITLLLMFVAMVGLASIVFIPLVGQVYLNMPPPGPGVELMRWCVGLASVLFGLAIVYRYGPNRKPPLTPWISPGAIVALVAWAASSWAFSTFLQSHDQYDVVYGSLGTAVAILLWFYLTALVVVFGGLLNAEIERKRNSAVEV